LGFFKTFVKIAALVLVCSQSFSQNYLEFVENKGQWDGQIKFKGDLSTGSFLLQSSGYRVVLYNKEDLARISKQGHAAQDLPKETQPKDVPLPVGDGGGNGSVAVANNPGIRGHIYEMRFLNANRNPQIIPDKAQSYSSNYILGSDSSKWISNCKTYLGVTYKNVYPNIDVRYYTANGVLKYDFIVNPGGDPSNIAMYFDGADELKVKNGMLSIKTSVDEVKEMPPYTYQLTTHGRTEIESGYEVKGNIVRFRLAGYTKNTTLVIDPSVVFSTFTGSRVDNWGYTATYDGAGNFYAGGIAFGTPASGFPATNGAFQTSFQGGANTGEGKGFDLAIMKFDPTGANRIYATYIGGSGNEQPHSMVVDAAGNLVIAGRTTSANYPVKGALQNYGTGGGWDIFVTKLNADGTGLIGSVKIGGSADDGVNIKHKYDPNKTAGVESIDRNYGDDARSEVILDGSGNVYFVSCTQSPNFLTTAVSAQTTLAGSNAAGRSQDAVVLKLKPDLSAVLFSVLFGGTDDDAAFVLALNPLTGNVFVAGATASDNFPGNKTGVKFPVSQGGGVDGFITEFTPTGSMVRSGYFGTAGIDVIYGIQFDKFGFPYISGTTTGSWPVVNAVFSQANGRQFIAKLQPDLSDYVYSTIFGSGLATPNISPTAFLVDRCENVYVSGWGGSANTADKFPSAGTKGLAITADAYQKTTDGDDFYFFVLSKNAQSQLYGSFFGENGGFGEHVDGGTSRFDQNGVIYQSICANCGNTGGFPTTPGVWASRNGTTQGCNLAAIKIAFNLAGIGAGLRASVNGVVHDTSGCVPLSVDFSDTLAMGQKYMWDFNDGSPVVTTTTPAVSHTFNTVGYYRVKLVAIDSNSCNIADSAYVTMRVRNDEVAMAFTATKLPPCSSLGYQFTNNSTAVKPFTATSFIWDFGDGTTQAGGGGSVNHTYAAPGTYNVKLLLVDTNYCNEPDSVIKQIRISTNVKAQFTTPSFGCVPYTAVFTNNSLGGDQFIWDFGDGATSTQTDPQHLYSTAGTYQVYLVAIDPNTCNQRDTSAAFTITVSPNPTASYSYTPNPTQANTPVTFLNASVGGTRFKWLFDDGDTLMTIRPDTTVRHLYNATGTYNTCLVAYNNSGCSDTTCQSISVTVNALVDVANSFTPNGDGINDKIYVRGYGIAKMTWTIYNRWGNIVYQSTDPKEGWDGRVNGKMQQQEVYHYTLIVEFGSKDRTTKNGDITLLR
jgi:gliding motility-associated-like protein